MAHFELPKYGRTRPPLASTALDERFRTIEALPTLERQAAVLEAAMQAAANLETRRKDGDVTESVIVLAVTLQVRRCGKYTY